MRQYDREIIVLKPTHRFLSFLVDQRPDFQWPALNSFQKDPTAYTFPRHDTDDALLYEMEKHFPEMFRHEVARWLGEDASEAIEGSFFDFLCFFKFELHSQCVCLQ